LGTTLGSCRSNRSSNACTSFTRQARWPFYHLVLGPGRLLAVKPRARPRRPDGPGEALLLLMRVVKSLPLPMRRGVYYLLRFMQQGHQAESRLCSQTESMESKANSVSLILIPTRPLLSNPMSRSLKHGLRARYHVGPCRAVPQALSRRKVALPLPNGARDTVTAKTSMESPMPCMTRAFHQCPGADAWIVTAVAQPTGRTPNDGAGSAAAAIATEVAAMARLWHSPRPAQAEGGGAELARCDVLVSR